VVGVLFGGAVRSSALDEETWEIFLKLLLGIADSLLSLPESEEGLTKRLCSHVLKVRRACVVCRVSCVCRVCRTAHMR
jgi:hypothetical protein